MLSSFEKDKQKHTKTKKGGGELEDQERRGGEEAEESELESMRKRLELTRSSSLVVSC